MGFLIFCAIVAAMIAFFLWLLPGTTRIEL